MGMTAFTLDALLRLDDTQFNKSLDGAEGKMSGFGATLGKIGGGIANVAKIAGGAMVAAGAAAGKILSSAIGSYSEYEQLVGGVETLFGTGGQSLEEYQKKIGITEKSSQKQIEKSIQDYENLQTAQDLVMQNAHKAFYTAGVDANTYMATVTSFSASLLQGLNGDTVKAAEISDMALTDMADNANKMGTDLSAIQNAYSGFAKQNYTMLDNLKLGYGGTRSEMQRLLKDAGKLTGKRYNLNNLADVYEAIHVIQEEMGIAGTTAEEAATTIQGSTNMMKAAWENLKIAIVDPNGNIDQAIQDLVDSTSTAVKNWVPAIVNGMSGLGTALGEIIPIITAELPGLIDSLLPGLITAASSLVDGLISAITESAPAILDGVMTVAQTIFDSLIEHLPALVEGLTDFVTSIVEALPEAIPKLVEAAKKVLPILWDSVKKVARSILVLTFGEDENGGIKWPTATELWEKIKAGLIALWNAIKPLATDILKFVFGEDEDGGIKWPTAEELWAKTEAALRSLWEGIQTAAKDIFKFIFGENEDGGIKWPTVEEFWEKIGEGLKTLWNGIKTYATGILKFIFGESADGGIEWPDARDVWQKIKSGLQVLWNAIKTSAKSILKFIFGESADGGIEWPDARDVWEKIKKGLQVLWNAIKSSAKTILKFVFGESEDGGIQWPTAKEIWEKIKSGLEALWDGIKSLAVDVFKFMFGEREDGGIQWPTAKELWDKIESGLRSLWNGIKNLAKDLFKFAFGERADGGIVFPSASKLWEKIKENFTTMWNGVKALIQAAADWALGELGLPDVDTIVAKIKEWWKQVKNGVGDLVIEASTVVHKAQEAAGNALIENVVQGETQQEAAKAGWDFVTDFMGGLFGNHNAKGEWNVPYDDYYTRLHRGEMVLTKSQARQYREGEGGNLDLGALTSAIVAAVRQGLQDATVNSYLDGKLLTDEVSRIMGETLTAGRFA